MCITCFSFLYNVKASFIYFRKPDEVIISSSKTIIFPYSLTISVTPVIILSAKPKFFSLSMIVIFLKPAIVFMYCLTFSISLSSSFFFLFPSAYIKSSLSFANLFFCSASTVCCVCQGLL